MRAEAKARVLGVILNDVIPDPRDVILVGLVHTCEGFKLLLSEEECCIFETYGPVVKVPFKMGGQPVVALMGPEANHWVNRHGRFYLRSKDYIHDFEREFGASRTLPGMDGAEHHKMRKSLRGAYSRAALARRLPELISLCRQSIGRWNEGDVFRATRTFQNHMSSQVSHLSIGVDCSHYIDELLSYEHRALVVHVQGALPKFMLSTPGKS